jgi:hypothetical protein
MIVIPIWLPRKPLAESWWFVTPNDKALLGEMVAKIAWSGLPNHCTDDCRHQTVKHSNGKIVGKIIYWSNIPMGDSAMC